MNEVEKHNRAVMLNRVRTYWLKGVLEESLHGGDLIDLSLAYRPSALAGSQEPQWQQTAEYDIPLPFGTKISTVFSAANGELLILGEPGAGKTTMLLQLVSDLLVYAEGDGSRPIPVVFSLASWNKDQPLDQWLVNELSNNYEVPAQLGRTWIDEKGFVPLLDGLDEVEKTQRTACADAINQFRGQYPGVWMLVTTRSKDYHALSTKLQLDKAIVLQPLNMEQIDAYLAGRGARLEGLRATLHNDPTMRELAQSPLMLSIMTLAYNRMPTDTALGLGSQEKGRKLLFDVYVERMSRYRRGEKEFSPQASIKWLSWLATMMEKQNRTMFFLESIQPHWLSSPDRMKFVSNTKRIILSLFLAAGLLSGVSALPAFGIWALPAGAAAGLLIALFLLVTRRLLLTATVSWDKIDTVETLEWSWPWAWLSLIVGLVVGLLLAFLISGLESFFLDSSNIPWQAIVPPLFSVALVADRAILSSEVKIRTKAGMGANRSRRNGLKVALLTIVAAGTLSILSLTLMSLLLGNVSLWAALPWIVGGSLFLGISAGLAHGGLAALQYGRLRALLQHRGWIPEQYVRFLDYAAERSLLRKVGGGYTFMHALLLEYFVKRGNVELFPNLET